MRNLGKVLGDLMLQYEGAKTSKRAEAEESPMGGGGAMHALRLGAAERTGPA